MFGAAPAGSFPAKTAHRAGDHQELTCQASGGTAVDPAEPARHWAGALSQALATGDGVGRELTGPIDRLIHALRADPFDSDAVAEVGVRLVETVAAALAAGGRLAAVERTLAAGEARSGVLFRSAAVGLLVSAHEGVVTEVNPAAQRILGRSEDELVGIPLADLLHPRERDAVLACYAELLDSAEESGRLRERTRLVRADGDPVWVHLAVSVLRDSAGRPESLVTLVQDVSHVHLLEQRLSYQGTHDPLTGLANRHAFIGKLEESLGGTAPASVLHLNLDAFSVINHGLGWKVGDELLRAVAGKLTEVLGDEPACVARFGADEFAVLLRDGPNIAGLAQRINAALAEPTYVDGHGVAASATIAVAPDIAPGTDPTELLCGTAIVLRTLKSGGRGQWGLVDPVVDQARRAQLRLAASVPGAWDSGQIQVCHRPIVALADRRVASVQASLRWLHPELGPLDHRACLRAIAETGFGLRIGRWLLGEAARQVAEAGPHAPRLYLELTKEEAVDPDLIAWVRAALAEACLAPARVDLGFPVVALHAPDKPAEDNLEVLAELGIGIVLYGYGAASRDLTYLDSLPLRAVRLVSSVASWVSANADSGLPAVLAARGLVPLVRASGLSMIVGSLRTAREAAWWAEVGVDLGEGAVFGEPGSLSEVTRL
ncbi:EAL domain-containing protein [Actinokineospora xionganensis]|uniref:EAL domain-containing protein n=1 Tax=Actinokineospora xionganensis TaxID=2684470 RepID=A0ABR7KZT7_9PSEU|nr:EAL domain-containing protein [Actinokineospora xionganensis]MBC6445684.1 EAL domain-containing protein [Actinokineospora xionganensis]